MMPSSHIFIQTMVADYMPLRRTSLLRLKIQIHSLPSACPATANINGATTQVKPARQA
jgi:hypothetical protein